MLYLLFACLILLATASPSKHSLGNTVSEFEVMCVGTENHLRKRGTAEKLLQEGKMKVGPCKVIFPTEQQSKLCFPGDGNACSDDDCVGLSIPCYEGHNRFAGVGECRHGVRTCVRKSKLSECTGSVYPQKEICDGKDNDCDGIVDNNFAVGKPCERQHGKCMSQGVMVCNADGSGVICSAEEKFPEREICWDGIDNDCNGLTDCEDPICLGAIRSCYTGPPGTLGVGICSEGQVKCLGNGTLSACQGQVLPTLETCDGIDEDCDGVVDNEPLIGMAVGSEHCVQGALKGCRLTTSEVTYIQAMAEMMEKHHDDYSRSVEDAKKAYGDEDSRHFAMRLATDVINDWLGHVISPSHAVRGLQMTITMAEKEAEVEFSPENPCEMRVNLKEVSKVLEDALEGMGSPSIRDLLNALRLRAMHHDSACLHELCHDGRTLKICGSEKIFGSNCS